MEKATLHSAFPASRTERSNALGLAPLDSGARRYASCGVPVASYKLQATGYELQATSYRLQATSYKLQATSYRLRVISYEAGESRPRRARRDLGDIAGRCVHREGDAEAVDGAAGEDDLQLVVN